MVNVLTFDAKEKVRILSLSVGHKCHYLVEKKTQKSFSCLPISNCLFVVFIILIIVMSIRNGYSNISSFNLDQALADAVVTDSCYKDINSTRHSSMHVWHIFLYKYFPTLFDLFTSVLFFSYLSFTMVLRERSHQGIGLVKA